MIKNVIRESECTYISDPTAATKIILCQIKAVYFPKSRQLVVVRTVFQSLKRSQQQDLKRWQKSNMWLKKPNLTNTGKLTKKKGYILLFLFCCTSVVLFGIEVKRSYYIAIQCDTLSFSLVVKIPDFGRWMRRTAAKPSTSWVEILSELVTFSIMYSAFSLYFYSQYCFIRNFFIGNNTQILSNFKEKANKLGFFFYKQTNIANLWKITHFLTKPYTLMRYNKLVYLPFWQNDNFTK